ncbi:MAG: phage antirepressor [Chlamydiales bacterium]|nr:phage antirepressor [Chlamydiales bacterium]
MNNIQLFTNNTFGQIRAMYQNGEPYVMLNDVCQILGLGNPSQAKARLKSDGVITNEVIDNMGRSQSATFINESNLYKLIFQSRKIEAEKFSDWVTEEVLPSIRKTGSFSLAVPTTFAEALRLAADQAEKIEQQNKLLIEAKPKVDFFDAVAGSKEAIQMANVAKLLGIKGIGRNTLFEILRRRKILQFNNIPYQEYIDRGYFRIVEQKYVKPDGDTCINIKTLVYQKGLDYIRKIIKEC